MTAFQQMECNLFQVGPPMRFFRWYLLQPVHSNCLSKNIVLKMSIDFADFCRDGTHPDLRPRGHFLHSSPTFSLYFHYSFSEIVERNFKKIQEFIGRFGEIFTHFWVK